MKGAIGAVIVILLAYLCVVETAQILIMKQAYDIYQEDSTESG
jgi:hypothetical protein